jgi:transcriptional regulator with XRE-family HTH domain
MNLVNKRVKEWREKKGKSQLWLAEQTGLEQSTISRIENGSSNPSVDAIQKIAKALNIPVSFLVEEDIESIGETVAFEQLFGHLDEETQKFLKDNTSGDFLILAKEAKKANLTLDDIKALIKIIERH